MHANWQRDWWFHPADHKHHWLTARTQTAVVWQPKRPVRNEIKTDASLLLLRPTPKQQVSSNHHTRLPKTRTALSPLQIHFCVHASLIAWSRTEIPLPLNRGIQTIPQANRRQGQHGRDGVIPKPQDSYEHRVDLSFREHDDESGHQDPLASGWYGQRGHIRRSELAG